jgi:hypothetical protein
VLAFQLFKYLNERYKFGKTFDQKYREENWSKNKLELEYLKSIFALIYFWTNSPHGIFDQKFYQTCIFHLNI